jgi:hypothetical protein
MDAIVETAAGLRCAFVREQRPLDDTAPRTTEKHGVRSITTGDLHQAG